MLRKCKEKYQERGGLNKQTQKKTARPTYYQTLREYFLRHFMDRAIISNITD
jgi:hypothetical protein